MVDYSKFDNIEDSDEEREKQEAVKRQPMKPWEPPFQPPSRSGPEQVAKKQIGRDGREILTGDSLEKQLAFVPESPEDALAKQFSRLYGGDPDASDQLQTEKAAPSKPHEPKKTCVRSDGRKKVHTTFPDGSELVEEFDERTDVLLVRKSRKASTLGREGEWVFEVGQAQEKAFDPHTDTMRASSSNPIFLRKDTPEHFQWRIRNLPYPANTYQISIDEERQQIVVRTTNKKYFKRIGVEDLARLKLKLKEESLTWKHQHNTLIISYARPAEVVKAEQEALKLVDKTAVKI